MKKLTSCSNPDHKIVPAEEFEILKSCNFEELFRYELKIIMFE